jgi:uncharacterized protein (DUF362 family)
LKNPDRGYTFGGVMNPPLASSRRRFLQTSLFGGLSLATGFTTSARPTTSTAPPATKPPSQVALTTGTDRADLVFRALKQFSDEVARGIGSRQVVIKPNNVSIDVPLCATHADTLRGVLEFLKSIGKLDNTVIAESAASGPTLDGFANYGYGRFVGEYGVKLMDLDQDELELVQVFDEKDFRPHPMRTCRTLLDANSYVISATRLKTHDRVVATLSLKNIVVGAPIKDAGFRWGSGKPGAKNDKPIVHGSGFRGINWNLFALAPRLHPDLAVLDGVEGMEGNGPVGGTPVDHRVCVVSPDWLAADRVAVELMGIDFAKVGYLNFCAQGGLGEADLAKIEILGPKLADHIRTYRLSDNLERQLIWMHPVQG